MDKYDASHDHDCYPASSVLKNKLNIQEIAALEAAERDITALTVSRVRYVAPPYSLENFKLLHRQLFSDLYAWAGEIRNVDISKGGTRLCNCGRIEAEALKIFSNLQENNWLSGLERNDFCEKLAEFYCELNMVHPFREGNGESSGSSLNTSRYRQVTNWTGKRSARMSGLKRISMASM